MIVNVCMYACVCIYIYMCARPYLRMHVCPSRMHVRRHACVCLPGWLCVSLPVSVCFCLSLSVCVCLCQCVRLHGCMSVSRSRFSSTPYTTDRARRLSSHGERSSACCMTAALAHCFYADGSMRFISFCFATPLRCCGGQQLCLSVSSG